METIKPEPQSKYFTRLIEVAKTLTQDQIDACAWAMGATGCGVNKDSIISTLVAAEDFAKFEETSKPF
jgi:hypothetical protein